MYNLQPLKSAGKISEVVFQCAATKARDKERQKRDNQDFLFIYFFGLPLFLPFSSRNREESSNHELGESCRTEHATTCAHCLNLVFTISGFSPGSIIAAGLPTDDVDAVSQSENDAEEDLDRV